MAFWSRDVHDVAGHDAHPARRRCPRAITPSAVARATYWLAWLAARRSAPARRAPRSRSARSTRTRAKGGCSGGEEERAIAPGIARARERLRGRLSRVSSTAPSRAETAFRLAARGGYDGVVAMYHDQATIPMKLVGFGEAVNVSLGLPIVRTSVDHGTGYDIAGTGTRRRARDARSDRARARLAQITADERPVCAHAPDQHQAHPERADRDRRRHLRGVAGVFIAIKRCVAAITIPSSFFCARAAFSASPSFTAR